MTSNEVLVSVDAVSKKFCRSLKRSLWYGTRDLLSELNPVHRPDRADTLRREEFWAIKDLSFRLERGECLGLIGRNGAGKTTLLRMLNGLIKPDAGRIEVRGRVGALIALGAGFSPVLTGRENIQINASLLGLSRREIESRIDDIIEFADVRDFIDSPVQSYSSGMQVRLGFAVATAVTPDLLFVDEVLAVGDFQFQRKCIDRMKSMIRQGVAIIFVSHNLPAVGGLCTRGLLLEKGHVSKQGHIDAVVQQYLLTEYPQGGTSPRRAAARQSGEVTFLNAELRGGDRTARTQFATGERITVRVNFRAKSRIEKAVFGYGIYDEAGTICCGNRTAYDNIVVEIPAGAGFYEFEIASMDLHTGHYRLGVVLFDENLILPYAYDPEVCFLTVQSPWLESDHTSPIVLPRTNWSAAVNVPVSTSMIGTNRP